MLFPVTGTLLKVLGTLFHQLLSIPSWFIYCFHSILEDEKLNLIGRGQQPAQSHPAGSGSIAAWFLNWPFTCWRGTESGQWLGAGLSQPGAGSPMEAGAWVPAPGTHGLGVKPTEGLDCRVKAKVTRFQILALTNQVFHIPLFLPIPPSLPATVLGRITLSYCLLFYTLLSHNH